jgi:cation diffusion facilitator CzcD-associated flavoprotein CzcO
VNSAVLQPRSDSARLPSERAAVDQWLSKFNGALAQCDRAGIASLFAPDSHWRDLVAFTWYVTPHRGADAIAASMTQRQENVQARDFAVDEDRTAPRRVVRAGIELIEAIVRFETTVGRCHGVLRLLASDPTRAFQLMTGLNALKGFEEKVGKRRPTGEAYSRNFGGTNWKEQREADQTYADRDPTALIVGGGQAGLSFAAVLGRLGVDALIVDRLPRVGDCWRTRYHSLALHNDTELNHLPYMPFPPSWPSYLPKDMLADWFETYAWAMEINFWTGTELVGANYDEASGRWDARVRRPDGTQRTLHPKHLVFANGLVGEPRRPDLPGLDEFAGKIMHTAEYKHGAPWRGKKAMVIGTGSSAHDVAQDLHEHGAKTTIVQRGETMVLSIDPAAKLTYGVYQGIPLEDGDLLATTNTLPVLRTVFQQITARMVELDRKMIDGLIAKGFKYTMGEDNCGHNMLIRRRYGGYYLDAGGADLIIKGEIGLLQFEQIDRFVAEGARLKDGTIVPADLIVLATGFVDQAAVITKLLGEKIAQKVGPVWGIAPDGEMNNMWKRTPQKGLWFIGGSFANCRIYSRYVALQVKAIEEGLLKFEDAPFA